MTSIVIPAMADWSRGGAQVQLVDEMMSSRALHSRDLVQTMSRAAYRPLYRLTVCIRAEYRVPCAGRGLSMLSIDRNEADVFYIDSDHKLEDYRSPADLISRIYSR